MFVITKKLAHYSHRGDQDRRDVFLHGQKTFYPQSDWKCWLTNCPTLVSCHDEWWGVSTVVSTCPLQLAAQWFDAPLTLGHCPATDV